MTKERLLDNDTNVIHIVSKRVYGVPHIHCGPMPSQWSSMKYSAHLGMISTSVNRCKKCEELECQKK